MVSLLFQALKIAAGGIIIHQLTKEKPLKPNKMANCTKLFLYFNKKLDVTSSKVEKIKTARGNIKNKIEAHFENKPKYNFKGTWTQGSYKMGSMIRTKDDTCDLDLGVYFKEVDEDVTSATVMDQVFKAVEEVTSTTPSKKEKCIRVIYKGDFHIDLPVYHFDKDEHDHPNLATRSNGWNESDPKDFYIWFNDHTNLRQLKRIVRYLKAWSDNKKGKFPSGLAFSIWAVQHLKSNERDDIALYEVLKKIKDHIDSTWYLEMPVTPYDDVCKKLTNEQKSNFSDAIEDFIDDAKDAIESDNQLEASKLWQKYFGDRFDLGADEDTDAKEAALRLTSNSILSGSAYAQKSGSITEDASGVKHKPHTNYGG